jgi:hypothetical protein
MRAFLATVAGLYLACVLGDAAGVRLSPPVPRPFLYFAQIASLFPHAAEYAIDFRVELYFCDAKQYHEIDPGPFFPAHEEDKENRFDRAMFFYCCNEKDPEDAVVKQALDEYLVASWNRAHPDQRVGGSLLMSLRAPIPRPGDVFPRYHRVPTRDLPKSVIRKYWYRTPEELAAARCNP